MTTHNGQPMTRRGGAGAGRGDDPHGVTPLPGFEHHTMRSGTPHQRTYKHALSVVDSAGSRRVVGVSDNKSDGTMYANMVGVQRPIEGERYEYTKHP